MSEASPHRHLGPVEQTGAIAAAVFDHQLRNSAVSVRYKDSDDDRKREKQEQSMIARSLEDDILHVRAITYLVNLWPPVRTASPI